MKISREWLVSRSRPVVFERGLDNYQQQKVQSVRQFGEVFTGEVNGTSVYFQTIDISKESLQTTCTCPYEEDDFICKHLVSVGLAILDKKYALGQVGGNPVIKGLASISATRDQLYGIVRNIIRNEKADKGEFAKVAVEMTTTMNELLIKESYTDGLRILLGFYEALQKIVAIYPNHALTRVFAGYYKSLSDGLVDYVHKKGPSVEEGKSMTQLVIDRWSKFDTTYENRHLRYDIGLFAPLFEALSANKVVAQFVKVRMEAYGFDLNSHIT